MCSHLKRHGPLTARTLFLTVLATLALLVGTAGHAHADPTPAEYEKMIDDMWVKIEPLVEDHNGTRLKLESERGKADALAKQIAPLQDAVTQSRIKAGVYAEYMYRGGEAAGVNALLQTGNPAVMAERLMSMNQVARHFNTTISDVIQAKSALDEAKAPLDALVAQLAVLEAEQAAQIKVIQAEIKKLDQLRLKAYANGGGIGNLSPVACPVSYPGGPAGTAIKFACSQIGKRYVFATAGPNTYDCSGLVLAAWAKAGVYLPHQSRAQRAVTTSISRSQLQVGDLVFYYSPIHHVALYIGKVNGVDWIVHANRPDLPVHVRKLDYGGPIHSYGRVKL